MDRQTGRQKKAWRNRIVGQGVKPASEFVAHPLNWRIHPKAQQDALSGVLEEVGWVQNVIESANSGYLLDGLARIALALREGDDTPVPFVAVDVSEQEEAKIIAALDPISAMAAADKQQLDALLREVDTGSTALQEMLAGLAGEHGMYTVPSLDELEAEYGEPNEQGFWPVVKIQVSPETFGKWRELVKLTGQTDEAKAFTVLLDAVDASVLGA